MNGEFGSVNTGGGNRSHGYGRSTWLWEVEAKSEFILNNDCVPFRKGKVEVKLWRCMVNLEW